MESLPAGLRRLRLQDLGSPDSAAAWAEKLQKLDYLECFSVDACIEESLLQLPTNLHSLFLQARSQKILLSTNYSPKCNFSPALGRLAQLQMLCIGCFLTSDLYQSLHGVVLPRVHTFGFQLPSVMGRMQSQLPSLVEPGYGTRCIQEGGVTNFQPDDGVTQLAGVFPQLQTIKIYYQQINCDIDCVGGAVELESAFMTPRVFPELRYIVCCCEMLDLKLVDVSPLCHVIRKY